MSVFYNYFKICFFYNHTPFENKNIWVLDCCSNKKCVRFNKLMIYWQINAANKLIILRWTDVITELQTTSETSERRLASRSNIGLDWMSEHSITQVIRSSHHKATFHVRPSVSRDWCSIEKVLKAAWVCKEQRESDSQLKTHKHWEIQRAPLKLPEKWTSA